ncbi:4-hydroxy-tetrahydrodipicolinate synthase, partial [Streptomyces albus]
DLLGLPGGPLRSPMVECSPEEIAQLKIDLAAGGVQL